MSAFIRNKIPADLTCVPVGGLIWYMGPREVATTFTDFKIADGSELPLSDFPDAGVCGVVTGTGANAKVTLPKLTDRRYIAGASGYTDDESGVIISESLPNITGDVPEVAIHVISTTATSALFTGNNTSQKYSQDGLAYHKKLSFDASRSNAVYKNNASVSPKSITAIPLIRVR